MKSPLEFDRLPELMASMLELVRTDVLVGVPDANADRDDDGGGPATNATIAYIHDNGAPEANIPARPFMDPGIRRSEDEICRRLKKAGDYTLAGDKQKAQGQLHAAGDTAANSIQERIGENIDPPLSPATIANRRRQRKTKSMRKGEKDYFKHLDAGMTPAEAQGAAGIVALENTLQLVRSITHVLRKR